MRVKMIIEIELQSLNSSQDLNEDSLDKSITNIQEELTKLNSNPNLNKENVVEMMSKIVPSQKEDSLDVNYQWYSFHNPSIFFVPCTLLHIAARFNCDKIASFLIERGAKVNLRDVLGSETPLHHAVKYGDNIEVVKILIAAGANVNAQERCGAEPLYYALKNNYIRTAKFLIDNGADLLIRTHIIQKEKDERTNTFDIIISTVFVVTSSILLYTTESPTFTMIGAIASAFTMGGIIYRLESMWTKHEYNSKLDEVALDDTPSCSQQPA